jgi:hypothetical protein
VRSGSAGRYRAIARAVTVVVPLTLAGCSGFTLSATNITRTGATLNGTAECGSTCSWYFRYGTNGRYQYRTPQRVVAKDTRGQRLRLPGENISGLMPGTTYQYQLCGHGDRVLHDVCVGPVGHPNTSEEFRTVDSKADCLYPANNLLTLIAFERRVGYHFRCALTFATGGEDWARWEVPWFTGARHPAEWLNWQDWKNCVNPIAPCSPGEHRQLIITTQLWPASEDGKSPLGKCAQGSYNWYAVALAANLVRAGLGDSIIRLQHEGNDTGSADDLPGDGPGGWPTATEERQWSQCWSNEARVMKAVPGARFRMDWTVNAYWRPIPLTSWYPGDDVVDIIGIDAYDAGLPASITTEPAAWTRIYTQSNGIRTVAQFASDHGKPMSLSEWGLAYSGSPGFGLGDDPAYVDNIAAVVRLLPVAYQSYFLNRDAGTLLQGASGARSLARYIAHFGAWGDTTGNPTVVP